MTNVLELSDVFVRYPDGAEALRGVTLAVPPGRRVALIGPNGAGKTTLQLAVLGGIGFSGRIAVDGIDLSRRTLTDVRARCGMVFENADDQLFMPTLLEDVAFGPLNQGKSSHEAEEVSRTTIEAVGLAGLERRSAHHLSAGQKRCASLATVLSMNVKLLLMDEPTSGLDFRSRRRLMDLLAGRTEAMVIATHDLELVKQLCQETVLLDDGRVVAAGETRSVLGDAGLLAKHGLQ